VIDTVDCVVVGAGVVGLACARAIAEQGREVIVLERHDAIGTETSSRNSEVIHAGIYYPTNTLKATLCVAGKRQLYAYCESHQVPFAACGKVIVAAATSQLQQLRDLQKQAAANAVAVEWLDAAAMAEIEPQVSAAAGLYSPSTGIIDSHALMLSYQGDLERAAGVVVFESSLEAANVDPPGLYLHTTDGELRCRWLVNSGGLAAPNIASQLLHDAPAAHYALGHYYAYSGASPFRHLVYPIPEPGGLGIHVTRDLGGQIKFGPDVAWRDEVDYDFPVDEASLRRKFAKAISRYYPAVDEARLHPSYTGIRPKIVGPGEPAADFSIAGPAQHGVAGLVNLLGIESPGLTSSLAIADYVVSLMHD
jgi:L-2-hydroxyglutarate oxidase LhgO